MSDDQTSSSGTKKEPLLRICENCGEQIVRNPRGVWGHRKPMSLRLRGCFDAKPLPNDLEQVCLNMIEESKIEDAGQRNIEQYIGQMTDMLSERGYTIPNPYED